jgi:hypothetical protein
LTVDSKNIEFGYELISTLPYAYYLHDLGILEKTISGNDTECLYYFSPNHEINPNVRSWYNTPQCKCPNINIHKPYLDKTNFLPPPLKEYYQDKLPKKIKSILKKEIVIICNRYNIEWGKKPINYFSIETLRKLFDLLQDEYQVIYINIEGRTELYDNAPPMPLGDFDLLKEYPKVINIHDLHENNKSLSFNTLQLILFAQCSKFITMNGGHSILASYFGGENIIMSKKTREKLPQNNSFYRWYHEFGGQRVVHVDNEIKLIDKVKSQWIDKDPVVNILVRTSNRPKAFNACINSILKQTYKNINIFVSIDNSNDYTVKYPVYPVFVKKEQAIYPIENNHEYGIIFPYNLYLNEMQKRVTSGLIVYLDDDNTFYNSNTLSLIIDEYKKGNDLIFWRVKVGDVIVPSDINFRNDPVCRDIDGNGMAFDYKYKDLAEWEPYKRGDYRVAKKLYDNIENKSFINEILTCNSGGHSGEKWDLENEKFWYVTDKGGFWYGEPHLIKSQIENFTMKRIETNEVPKHLIKQL